MLELLLIMFIAMAVIGGLGIAFMYLVKNPKGKNILFYSMAIFALFVAMISITGFPSNYMMEKGIAAAIGALAVVGVVMKVKFVEKNSLLPQHLVTASILLGMGYLFLG